MSLRFLSRGLARCAMAPPQWARQSPFPTTTTTATTIVLRSFASQKVSVSIVNVMRILSSLG
jgi:hypothetical protein